MIESERERLTKRRVWYVDKRHNLVGGRLISLDDAGDVATVLIARGGLQAVKAHFSEGKQPGTWHYQSTPS